jgi:FtsP/CotA-like multicopper oxidase with cupredoxin domain
MAWPRGIHPEPLSLRRIAGSVLKAHFAKRYGIVSLFLGPALLLASCSAYASVLRDCARPLPGSVVAEPQSLRSQNGVLRVELIYRNFRAVDGQEEYCYQSKDGGQAPTLRVRAGDLLILRLKNELVDLKPTVSGSAHTMSRAMEMPSIESPCAASRRTALSTNLHFHGMSIRPVCHEDDVLNTSIQPGDAPFEYRIPIPSDEPPGLYWYHPHVHGYTNSQVLGGASGALIVEGIEEANGKVAGLPERTLVLRDQELLHPDAQPASAGPAPPPVFRDARETS